MILAPYNTPTPLHPWLDELNALYAIYVNVMDLKRRRDDLRGLGRVWAYLYVAYGYACDVWFNLTTASKIFNDCARELTLTARFKRYRKSGTPEQAALAEFLCDQFLDQADPDGDHC